MRSIIIYLQFLICFSVYSQDSVVVYFSFNSDEILAQKIKMIQKKLIKEATTILKISGYTDSVGNFYFNQDLSERRAKKIKGLLDESIPQLLTNVQVQGNGELPISGQKGRKVVIYYNKKISNQIRTAQVGEQIKINNLNFEPGEAILLPGSEPSLTDLLSIMQEIPKLKIAIEGHICCDVNDITNLSEQRAKVVYNYLVKNGIKENRLTFKGFGATKPIYALPEANEFQQVSNRRVEIRIISKD